jgi:hypothetical protein
VFKIATAKAALSTLGAGAKLFGGIGTAINLISIAQTFFNSSSGSASSASPSPSPGKGIANLLPKTDEPSLDPLGMVTEFTQSAVQAINTRIAAEQKLQSVMGRIPGMTQQGISAMAGYADQLESISAIKADVGMTGMAQLGQYVGNPKNIQDLTKSMYDLAASTYGVNVSQDQMKQSADLIGQAMTGQMDVLEANGFKLTEQQQQMLKYGSEAEKTAAIVGLMNDQIGGTAQAVGATPEGAILRLKNAWTGVQEAVGNAVMPVLMDVVQFLMDNMPLVETVFVAAFTVMAQAVGYVVDALLKVWSFFADNWSVMQPILIAIGAVFIAAIIIQLYLMAAAWLAALWPILLIVAAVGLIIYILQLCGLSMQQIVGGIVGGLMFVFGVLWNYIAGIWNFIVSFAEFLINLFKDPVYTIQMLFFNMAMGFLQGLYTMTKGIEDFAGGFAKLMLQAVNFVLGGINKLIDGLNNLPGVDIKPIKPLDEQNVHLASDGLKSMMDKLEQSKPTTDKSKVNLPRMQQKDPVQLAKQGYKWGSDRVDNVSSAVGNLKKGSVVPDLTKAARDPKAQGAPGPLGAPAAPGGSRGNNIDKIGRVNEVGTISDTVDISSEDLKVMRDLAEIKSIQNFVTLTPTVQVTTGNITKEVDIDTMIGRISQAMEREIASAAGGVYNR